MPEILHAADLHLDTQPSGLRSYPELVAHVLRDASLQAFDALVDAAIERRVVACLFAGDIYDGAERGLRAQLRLRDGLERLDAAGIRSYLVHGNHDPVDEGWSAIRSWPERVVVFDPGEPQAHLLPTDGGDVTVHGVSYATRATVDNLAARFRRSGEAPVQIGVLHTNVGDQPGHAPYAPCSLDDLRAVGLDYWALGHVHTRRTLCGPHPWVVYPGNLQGRSPRRAEMGPKGAVVVDIAGGAIPTEPSFLPLDVVRFDTVQVDAREMEDLGELAVVLADAAAARRHEHGGRSLVLRGELIGRAPLRTDLRRPGVLEELRGELQQVDHEPFVWWDRIVDRTLPTADLEAASTGDDLVAHVLRTLAPGADADGALREALEDELPAGLARAGVSIASPEDPEVLAAARVLAHDLLAEDLP